MSLPEKRIVEFIEKHHVLTLATVSEKGPYCANCFYVYLQAENCFAVLTDLATRHGAEATANPSVAASIVLETETVGKIQGLQITGSMYVVEGNLKRVCQSAYYKRFPYAALKPSTIWIIEPEYMKMTHNKLGFGVKLIWEKTGSQKVPK